MLQAGDTLAGYRIEGLAGVGGMGIVYRATQMSLDRPVALKVLSGTLVGNQTFRERFRREGRHAAALDHPNIIPVYEAGEAGELMFIAMRLVDGPSLADLVDAGAVTGREAVRVITAIASALDAAHEAGLVHRDIKPQNILLTKTGHPYLADFGITKGSDAAALTHSGDFVGSLNYVAPEQIDGTDVTGASDIYSLTAVLFHCLSGQYPYQRESDAALMHAHLMAPAPTLAERGIGAPPALDEVFRTGMSKIPGQRYPTGAALAEACHQALASVSPAILDSAPAFAEEGAERVVPAAPPRRSTEPDAPAGGAPPQQPPAPAPTPVPGPEPAPIAWATLPEPAAAAPPVPFAAPLVDPGFPPQRDLTAADVRRELPPTEEPAYAPSILRPALLGLGASLLIVGAPLLGFTLGRSDPSPAPARAQSAALTLEHDASWSAGGGAIAGLALTQPIALRRSDGVHLAAGRLAHFPAGFDPVPDALRRRFAGKTADATIRLGAWTATRHAVALRGGAGRLWLALVPDSKGWVAIACEGPGADRPAVCPAVARSLAVRGATAVSPGPSAEIAGGISGALTDLDSARRTAVVPLSSSALRTRAHAADREAQAHVRAATRLTALPLRPQERPLVRALARDLRAQSTNLVRLARATTGRRRAAYLDARSAIGRQEKRVETALRRLRSIGYDA